jgi:hypothetical protein
MGGDGLSMPNAIERNRTPSAVFPNVIEVDANHGYPYLLLLLRIVGYDLPTNSAKSLASGCIARARGRPKGSGVSEALRQARDDSVSVQLSLLK